MTTSSALKDNTKGSKKVIKQPSTMSSSLKTIMKYGGSATGGLREVSKKSTEA